MAFLRRLKLMPYWDGEEHRTLFRNEPGVDHYNVTRQAREKIWPDLIDLLRLHTHDDVKRLRRLLRERGK